MTHAIPTFVAIAAAVGPQIYALDETGRVWERGRMSSGDDGWVALPSHRWDPYRQATAAPAISNATGSQ